MTAPKIEPALTDEEWAELSFSEGEVLAPGEDGVCVDIHGGIFSVESLEAVWHDRDTVDEAVVWQMNERRDIERLPALIALANAALPDSDPRKITRERVALLRTVLRDVDWMQQDHLPAGSEVVAVMYACHDLLNALESYLPPEKPNG